ncbi:Aspartate-semialdehyde dehydrogenase 2 [Candidatus Hepatincola sp. Pdp]
MQKYKVAILGAGSRIGTELLELLEERKFPIEDLILLDTEESQGAIASFQGSSKIIKNIASYDFTKVALDFVFSCAGSKVSLAYVEKIATTGTLVIDTSNVFSNDSQIPLIIPEVNGDSILEYKNKNIVVTPNCITTIMLMALAPLHEVFMLKRVVASTFQAVSEEGNSGLEELFEQTRAVFQGVSIYDTKKVFTKQIAFNVIPHIGDFDTSGNTNNEVQLSQEVNRILGEDIALSVTCVKVPTFISSALSINVEFLNEVSEELIKNVLQQTTGISIIDHRANEGYVTPVEAAGESKVYISRIRLDSSKINTINMWVVADNLRKGTALNMLQIAEKIIELL